MTDARDGNSGVTLGSRRDEPARSLGEAIAQALVLSGFAGEPLFTAEGFARAAEATAETGRRIGEAAWTFPMSATPRETADLLRASEREDIDTVFVRYYDEGGYEALRGDLLEPSRTALDRWRPLIVQSLTAFDAGLELVVVPALLTVVEGVLAHSGGPGAWASVRAVETAKALREKSLPASMTRAIYVSVEEFIKAVFESGHSFAGGRPHRLNRHWILHGRDEAAWNRADGLRLFQAIDTIAR